MPGVKDRITSFQQFPHVSSLFIFVALSILGCDRNLNEAISQAESGCSLQLIGNSLTLYYKGVRGAGGIYAHCSFDVNDHTYIERYTMDVSREGTLFKRFSVKGSLFTSEVHQFLEGGVLPGDRIDFTEIIAFKNETQLVFDKFWFVVE